MAHTHLAYPDLALDKLSGTDHDQDAEKIIQLIERKISFALGDAHGDADELTNYTFRKKALFSSLLPGPVAEWYENIITNATTWENVRTNLITRFSDGRNKLCYRMEVEHRVTGDEEIRNFYTVSNERFIKAGPMIWMVLRPLSKMRNEQHKEDKGTWTTVCEDFDLDISNGKLKSLWWRVQTPLGTQIIQKDLILKVSSTVLSYEAQTKAELATLEHEIKKPSITVKRISRQCPSSNFRDFSSISTGETKNYPIL